MDRLEQLILKLLSEVGDGYTVDGPNRLESMEDDGSMYTYIRTYIE